MEFSMVFVPILLMLIGVTVVAGLVILWIAMIIDSCRRQFDKGIERVIWLIILILFNIPASLIYFFLIVKYHPQGLIDKEGRFK
jgi:Phospholipase_D-nuclease N-terminal